MALCHFSLSQCLVQSTVHKINLHFGVLMQCSKTGYLLFKSATIYVSVAVLLSKTTTDTSVVTSKIFCEINISNLVLYIFIHDDYNCLGESSGIVPHLEM